MKLHCWLVVYFTFVFVFISETVLILLFYFRVYLSGLMVIYTDFIC